MCTYAYLYIRHTIHLHCSSFNVHRVYTQVRSALYICVVYMCVICYMYVLPLMCLVLKCMGGLLHCMHFSKEPLSGSGTLRRSTTDTGVIGVAPRQRNKKEKAECPAQYVVSCLLVLCIVDRWIVCMEYRSAIDQCLLQAGNTTCLAQVSSVE